MVRLPTAPLCFAGDVFTLWRVRRMADVTLDSLALLRLLKPVPGGAPARGLQGRFPHGEASLLRRP